MVCRTYKENFPSRSDLVDFITNSSGQTSRRQIARAFSIKGEDRSRLKLELKALVEEGLVQRVSGKIFNDPDGLPSVAVLQAVQIKSNGNVICEPTQTENIKSSPTISLSVDRNKKRISGLRIGDKLLARLKRIDSNNYEARLIRFIGKGQDEVLGEIVSSGSEIQIRTSIRSKKNIILTEITQGAVKLGDIVRAEVINTRRRGMLQARLLENLGQSKDPQALSRMIVHKYGFSLQFPEAVLAEAKKSLKKPLGKREDLRSLSIVTIDPSDARDHDDAVWATPDHSPQNREGWNIIVAIADVAHYILPDSMLDKEASKRCNSVYLPNNVIPMLPEIISTDICSLKADCDRPVIALHITIDSKGKKLQHHFTRALIRSRASLTYEQIQKAIDGETDYITAPLMDKVIDPLIGAHKSLLHARHTREPLEINSSQTKILFSQSGEVQGIEPAKILGSHKLIENLMVLANICAVETLKEKNIACIFRIHEKPDREKMVALGNFLRRLNIKFPNTEKIQPSIFNHVLNKAGKTAMHSTINQAVLRTQSQARYSSDNLGHFGLALPIYSHFTSPIRRYSDLLIHRSLITACKLGKNGLEVDKKLDLKLIAEKISQGERQAMAAERELIDKFVALHLSKSLNTKFQGRISGVTRFGLFITLEEINVDGLIFHRNLGNEYFLFNPDNHSLTGEKSGIVWRLGDPIKVRLIESDVLQGHLGLKLYNSANK